MSTRFREWRKSLKTKSTLAIIITAAVLIETTSVVQYKFASDGIREEVQQRAESELKVRNLKIKNVMSAVEVAVQNMEWIVELCLNQPDSMYAVTRKMLTCNDIIVGSAVAFEPNYYPKKGRQFSPYSYKTEDGTIRSKQLGTDDYEYHDMEWYAVPMRNNRPHWSEPYYDEGGGEMMMSTYSMPIHDAEGRTVGIFTADVSLDWLGEVINANRIYPSSVNMMISRTGQMMACPVESLVMRANIIDLSAGIKDTSVKSLNRDMMAGGSGCATVTDDNGDLNYVYYAPVDNGTGWSMAVICRDREIYNGLRQIAFNLFVMMLIGLILLGFIIARTIHSVNKLQIVNAEKERIGSELHIASEIQKGMLPKIFPPYPDRNDIEIFGHLVPAKEVGGDLFDFYIRENKLFFCIGDVSGKGVPASLVMAVTRSLFRNVSAHTSLPNHIVTALNEALAEGNETNMFVTLFVGVLDLSTGDLSYCNAGHGSPLFIGNEVALLPCHANIALGIISGMTFNKQETKLDPGTTIFLYTDGLNEAENTLNEQFGQERILRMAATLQKEKETVRMVKKMEEAVHDFVGEAEQSDDLTMLAIRLCATEK